jgi:hypothetical protein
MEAAAGNEPVASGVGTAACDGVAAGGAPMLTMGWEEEGGSRGAGEGTGVLAAEVEAEEEVADTGVAAAATDDEEDGVEARATDSCLRSLASAASLPLAACAAAAAAAAPGATAILSCFICFASCRCPMVACRSSWSKSSMNCSLRTS